MLSAADHITVTSSYIIIFRNENKLLHGKREDLRIGRSLINPVVEAFCRGFNGNEAGHSDSHSSVARTVVWGRDYAMSVHNNFYLTVKTWAQRD